VIVAPVNAVKVGTALRAVLEVADEALDVAASEERILCLGVSGISTVLGDRSSIWLGPTAPTDLPAMASSHPDAIEAELEEVVAALSPAEPTVYLADDRDGAWLGRHGLRQMMVAPLQVRGRVIGILAVTRDEQRDPLDDSEIEFVAAMADMMAVAVHGARIRNDAMMTVEDLRQQVEVTESISDALVACDSSQLIVSWNTGAEQVYGYSRDEAIGCHLFTLLATEFYTTEGAEVEFDAVLAELNEFGQWSGELRERRADGAPLVVLSSVTQMLDVRQRVSGLVAVSRDVTAQRREEYEATHDPLTGLPNRRMLNGRLYEAVARACRNGQPLAVLFIDLDEFKPINDTYGHAAGDAVLIATARRLGGAVRQRDSVGRLGGDEFLVILEEAGTMADIVRSAERIKAAISEPIQVDGATVTVQPSIGICVAERPATDPVPAERLLDAADRAMYVAKREKRGTFYVTAP
jgi:diguanylate cyclase (GGDEF)-like protein/PAS domain S-box-containing protein